MAETRFFNWTYPNENDDPYFDIIAQFYTSIDDGVFALMNTACNVVIPPSDVSWDSTTKQLSWTGDWEIPMMSVGFSLKVAGPGMVQLWDGSRLIIVVPSSLGNNATAAFQVVTSAPTIERGLFTVGFCRGSKFYANFPQVLE